MPKLYQKCYHQIVADILAEWGISHVYAKNQIKFATDWQIFFRP